jgi:NAD(P)-dependent dehydrogenase (short-subunit alcohol dehydrogenase family)
MLAVNLRGVLVGSRLAAQRMLPRGRGTIVNVASQAGRFGFPGGVTYCASKWGVVGASEALAAELHGSGVRVRVVLPSAVSTDLIAGLGGGWREPAPATPEQAGAAVLRAATSRVFAHGVPRRTTAALNAVRLLPHGARAGLIRLGGAGEYLLHPTDATARGRYLDRAGAHR